MSRRSWQALVAVTAALALSTPAAYAADPIASEGTSAPTAAATQAAGPQSAASDPANSGSAPASVEAPDQTPEGGKQSSPAAPTSADNAATTAGSEAPQAATPSTTPAAPATQATPDTPATRAAQAAAATCVDNPQVTLGAAAASLGGTIRVNGTGWCNRDPASGSTIAVKIDAGGFSRLDTSLHANKTIWAIFTADADGSFSTAITIPDGTSATSTPAASVGGPHTFTLLRGSLSDSVSYSVVTSPFDFVAAGTGPDAPDLWGYPLTSGTAKAWVQRSVTTTDGTVRIVGTGWTTSAQGPSTIAVKLNSSDSHQFERATGIEESDATIWAMGRATVSGTHQFKVAADGSFDVELDLPAGLTSGQYLTVRLASGKFGAGDVQRSVLSPLLAIDGTAYSAPDEGADVVCKPTTAATTVKVVTPTVQLGGIVKLSGTGWCHPTGGASRIGIKIDEGAISHLDDAVHSNRTIWAIIQANHATGDFTASIALPDGTTASSTPALTNGAHTLRFLSGSLRAGDTIRSLDAEFVVGTYRPNGAPDPVSLTALGGSTKNDISATLTAAGKVRITVPGRPVGTWVFLTAYVADGSPRYPWGERWFQLDARHRITLTVPSDAPAGAIRLVAQSGDPGEVGQILGWTRVTLRPLVQTRPVAALAPVVALPVATLVVPALPARSFAALAKLDQAGMSATSAARITTLTIPSATPGQPVFLTVYAAGRQIQAGWVTADAERRVRVDLSALGDGAFRISAQASSGTLLGWVPVTVGAVAEMVTAAESADSSTPDAPAQVRTVARTETKRLSGVDGWLLGLGAVVLAGTGLFIRFRKVAA